MYLGLSGHCSRAKHLRELHIVGWSWEPKSRLLTFWGFRSLFEKLLATPLQSFPVIEYVKWFFLWQDDKQCATQSADRHNLLFPWQAEKYSFTKLWWRHRSENYTPRDMWNCSVCPCGSACVHFTLDADLLTQLLKHNLVSGMCCRTCGCWSDSRLNLIITKQEEVLKILISYSFHTICNTSEAKDAGWQGKVMIYTFNSSSTIDLNH